MLHHTFRPHSGALRHPSRVPAFRRAAPPYVCGAIGPACTVYGSLASASQPVSLAHPYYQTWLCDSVRPVSPSLQGRSVLRAEIAILLTKDAIEPVPPADMKTGFYSPYFIVPKKGGGLRPILDLRVLNRSLHRLSFKMLTQKRIFKCIRPQDWFAEIDLKDAYFHVSILPRHRPFLRFAVSGVRNDVLRERETLHPVATVADHRCNRRHDIGSSAKNKECVHLLPVYTRVVGRGA
ncbi:hypothetical protein PO909_032478 [Leuciscus waleckii]